MTKEKIESLIRRAYDLGYKEGSCDSKKPTDTVTRRVSKEEDMVAKFLEDNEVTTVTTTWEDDPTQTSCTRMGI